MIYGPYWLHLKEAWQRRDHPNLHFVFYEDLKADITGELKKLDAFLGTGLSGDQLANVNISPDLSFYLLLGCFNGTPLVA